MPNLTLDEYLDWHQDKFAENLRDNSFEKSFAINSVNLLSSVSLHAFFKDLQRKLTELESEGILAANEASSFGLVKKGFSSVVNKIYRRNCHWNRHWPSKPKGGWIAFSDVYTSFDDIIRGTIVTRYLDGGELIGQHLQAIGEVHSVGVEVSPRATDQGHYAWHIYVTTPHDVIVNGAVQTVDLKCEIQIITLLQSVLKGLTHQFYERSRIADTGRPVERRWQFQSPEFKGEYLGHTLHLVDSMLVELREEAATGDISVEGDKEEEAEVGNQPLDEGSPESGEIGDSK